jgi:ABC-2 type transport system ATP-binding protein
LTGPFVPPPESLAGELTIRQSNGRIAMDTAGDLSPVLGWLAALPLSEVQIEPLGLRSVYERFHPTES